MKSIPFFIGFVLIIPMTNVFALDRRHKVQQVNGHGVGALLYAEQAILHEAIKDDIGQDAQLFWVGNPIPADPVSCRAIDIIMANIRFVSIANAWYRVVPPVVTDGRANGAVGARYPAASTLRGGRTDGISGVHCPDEGAIAMERSDGMAGANYPAEGVLAAGRAGLLVTLFGEESGILMDAGDAASPEMAIVVERYAGCQPTGLATQRSVSMLRISASNT